MVPCVVEQHLGAEDVGEDELGRAEDRPVDVRLGREVDDRLCAGRRRGDGVRVGDVALVELVLDAVEIRPVAGVRQLVEHDDLVARAREPPREMRADEAGAAGDENAHRVSRLPRRCKQFEAGAQAVAPVRQLRRTTLAAEHRVGGPWRARAELDARDPPDLRVEAVPLRRSPRRSSAHVQSPAAATW